MLMVDLGAARKYSYNFDITLVNSWAAPLYQEQT